MKTFRYFLLALFVMCTTSASFAQSIINSFEQERDLEHVSVTSGVDFARSTAFPALGAYSCRVGFPENGGTLFVNNIEGVYQGNIENSGSDRNESFLCFIWSDEEMPVALIVRDSLNRTFTRKYQLKKGDNHIQLRLSEVKKLDLNHVKSIGIHTDNKCDLYLDYLALDRYHPVLDELGRWDVAYSDEIKTDHYPWGTGFVNGPIKSYSISTVFDGRGIIELKERLDLDIQVTTMGRYQGAEKYGFGDFYMRRSPWHGGDSTTFSLAYNYIAADLHFGPEFDVIIWPGIRKWESYPETVRNALMNRVKKGTGLVLIYPVSDVATSDLWELSPLKSVKSGDAQHKLNDLEMPSWPAKLDSSGWKSKKPHYITSGLLFSAFPSGSTGVYPYEKVSGEVLVESSQGNPVLAVGRYGEGRVVVLAYPERGLIPRVKDPWETGLHFPYWEYMWSMVARSVVWASGKEPEIVIEDAVRTSRGLDVYLNKPAGNLSLEIQVTDAFGVVEEEITVPVGGKKAKIKFDAGLHGGKHMANIRLTGPEGTYDWYSVMFSTPKVAGILSIENDKNELPAGDEVRSTIVIKTDTRQDVTVTGRLYDNYDRLVDEKVRNVAVDGEQAVDIPFSSENVLTNLGNTDFSLNIDGRQTDRKVKEIFFYQPRVWDDYDVTMYHFGPNPVPGTWPAVDRQLQKLNVTTLAAYTLSNSKHANYKVQAQTRIHGVESPDRGPDLEYYEEMLNKYLETHDKYGLRRKYGLKDPAYLNAVRDELTAMIGEWKKFSPSAYYIYEEPSITRYDGALDLCFRESTLEAMRVWLQKEYGSLEALNDQWGTDFPDWQVVIPDDTYEARARGNYSSWADHRTFMEICWADQFRFVRDIVNEVDPGGLVQLSGTQAASSHNGYDYSRLDKYVGQMNPYDIDNQLEYHHNFNPDLKISGQAGYGALGKGVIYDYYHHLFLKETGGAYVFWQVSSLNPDLRMCEAGRVMKAGFDELLKGGVGRLIDSYDPENELKIAIHFSYPSVHGSWIVDGEIVPETGDNVSNTLKQYNRDRDGWVKILHDAGYGFDFISYSSIEKGGLQANDYKVFILPMSYALSDREVDEITEFVKQGGILIADALPGVMDGHAKFRPERALADVFGIKARSYKREELITPGGETGLIITDAEALSTEPEKPEILHNNYGRGSAWLLNFFLEGYPEKKMLKTNGPVLQRVRDIFDGEQLRSGIILLKATGSPAVNVQKYSFSATGSKTRLLGLLPEKNGAARSFVLQVDEPVHLYDIRNKKYLGEGSEFPITLKPSVPVLFGLLGGTVEGIETEMSSAIERGGKIAVNIRLTGESISDLRSVVHINVIDPQGKMNNHYSKNCDIVDGRGVFGFTTALNEQPGLWKIRISDTITGMQKEVTFSIK